jgi:hypothetical protein
VALGQEFAAAVAAKDEERLLTLLHSDVDFRAMTPSRVWEANRPDEVISVVLGNWFDQTDEIEALEKLESDAFADRQRVGYRFRVRNPEGQFVVEQQAYISERDGRIGWMRVLCSGYRAAAAE